MAGKRIRLVVLLKPQVEANIIYCLDAWNVVFTYLIETRKSVLTKKDEGKGSISFFPSNCWFSIQHFNFSYFHKYC